MQYIYPAIFTREKSGLYSVDFPDFENTFMPCFTSGADLKDAMFMAKDALCLTLYDFEERDKDIPAASDIKDIKVGKDGFVQYITCDTDFYKKFYEKKAVRKNVTIPSWLDEAAEAAGVNFSLVLQQALKEKLRY
jgi:predicted RNase H-like HicB family nuclease